MSLKNKKKEDVEFDGMDEKKLIELAQLNKSKKHTYTFKDFLTKLSADEMDILWENLCQMVMKKHDAVSNKSVDSSQQSEKKLYTEISRVIQAAIDLAFNILSERMPVPKGFLQLVIFLNGILLRLPSSQENLKNSISNLCEKMVLLNYTEQGELIASDTVIYLLRRSTSPKATKKDVKRVYVLRNLLPRIIKMEDVDSNEIWDLLKKCVVSPMYTSIPEGQKIITLALTLDILYISHVHKLIKNKLASCSVAQAIAYGKAYVDAWYYAFKIKCPSLKDEIEIGCVSDLILTGVMEKRKSMLSSVQKVLAQFLLKKKDIDVQRMLYSYYKPILWLHLTSHDGLIRSNAAKLFFDVFPLEDPDLDLVSTDQELNEQMLMIKDLLLDDYPIVRSGAIIGVCMAMSVHWELFSEDMLQTYFKILTEDLSCDSSSSEVRLAVAKGFKVILENPLTVPTLQNILPKLKHLFDDISNLVRIAFCQLLLSVKKVWGIKYYDIVPLDHLLARMEEDPAVCKLIVNLIHNSYFPKDENPRTWLVRCIELIKTNKESSREFFRHIPRYIHVEASAKFMIQAVKAIHLYTSKKLSEKTTHAKSAKKSSKKNKKSLSDTDVETLEAAGFQDPDIVMGLLDAVSILYLSCNLKKPDNKAQLKMVVGNLSKWMDDLVLYYENTPVWTSAFYLASLLPHEHVTSLANLCHQRLNSAFDNELDEGECTTLLQCLCNQGEGDKLLLNLKKWIDEEFNQQICSRSSIKTPLRSKQTPTPKRRRIVKNKSINPKSSLALKMLNDLLEKMPCQKILLMQCPKELKSFLDLFDNLKLKTESLKENNISEEESNFVTELLLSIAKIAVLLEDENRNGVKMLEAVVIWFQDKLFKIVKPPENSTTNVTRSSIAFKSKCSSDFKKLVVDMSRELCVILADATSLGYFNAKKLNFAKFGVELLNLDPDGLILLRVSKLLLAHVWSGSLLYLTQNQESVLQIAPDFFNKINQISSNENLISSIPGGVLKEIQHNLSESIKLLKKCYGSSFHLNCAMPLLTIEPKPTDSSALCNNSVDEPSAVNESAELSET